LLIEKWGPCRNVRAFSFGYRPKLIVNVSGCFRATASPHKLKLPTINVKDIEVMTDGAGGWLDFKLPDSRLKVD
jgi:hypothetical protein